MSDGLNTSTWNPDMDLISTNNIYIILYFVVSTDNCCMTLAVKQNKLKLVVIHGEIL